MTLQPLQGCWEGNGWGASQGAVRPHDEVFALIPRAQYRVQGCTHPCGVWGLLSPWQGSCSLRAALLPANKGVEYVTVPHCCVWWMTTTGSDESKRKITTMAASPQHPALHAASLLWAAARALRAGAGVRHGTWGHTWPACPFLPWGGGGSVERAASCCIDLLICKAHTLRLPVLSPPCAQPCADWAVPRGRYGHHSVRVTNSAGPIFCEGTASCELPKCVGDEGRRRKPLKSSLWWSAFTFSHQSLVNRRRWKAVAFAEERAVAGCWFVAVLPWGLSRCWGLQEKQHALHMGTFLHVAHRCN